MQKQLMNFLGKETVFVVSGLAAMMSAFFVLPSAEYVHYIDFKVITLLFCLMAVVEGLKEIGTFEVLSQRLLEKGSSVRFVSIILVSICFFTSMLVTNDVALITMMPFTFSVLGFLSEKRIIFIIVMETVAANLGSMLTPVGNPQNLYLFSYFDLSTVDFLKITLPMAAVSFVLIVVVTLSVPTQKLSIVFDVDMRLESRHLFMGYLALFLLCLATVMNLLDYRILLIVTVVTLAVFQRNLLKRVDYFLLLTFVFFFIFVGNISRIEEISEIIRQIITNEELISAVILSQIISNVPAAVMLSSFTDNYKELLLGVNLGGLGTLIASLASLISFKIYSQREKANKKLYILAFSVVNILFLILLLPICYIVMDI